MTRSRSVTAVSSSSTPAWFGLKDLYAWRDLLVNLTLRDIRGKYKRTALGQLWSLINPVAQLIIYAVLFGVVLGAKPEAGHPSGLDVFVVWLASGLLPWLFFANCVSGGMSVLVSNANLVQKVYFPRSIIVISHVAGCLFTHSIEMGVLVVVVLAFGGAPLLYLPATLLLMVLVACFALGIAFMLSVANVYYRDTQHFIGIALQMWFYATAILYPLNLVAKHGSTVVNVYRLNPMERFTEAFRNTLYDGRWPSASNLGVVTLVSLVTLAVGYMIFMRYEGRLAEEL